jgi:hypothetical protein
MRGSEDWTREPQEQFGGKSYSEVLRDAGSDEERLIVLMDHVAGRILRSLDTDTFRDLLIRHSIWKIKGTTGQLPRHSTSGVGSDSVNRLKGRALNHYEELFGDIHARLGY